MDIIPESLIDAFQKRIKYFLKGIDRTIPIDEEHPSLKREFNRIKKLNNGIIPDKIKNILK